MNNNLQLLGAGLDAILQHSLDGMPATITPAARMRRYRRAVTTTPPDRWHGLRVRFGAIFQAAWRSGMKPNLATWARQFQQIAKACDP